MRPIILKITRYTLIPVLVFNVLFLNFGLLVCIGMTQDDCCHKLPIEKGSGDKELIKDYCEMKQTSIPIDISINKEDKLSAPKCLTCESVQYANLFSRTNSLFSEYHSPPIAYRNDLYLSNLNLRI